MINQLRKQITQLKIQMMSITLEVPKHTAHNMFYKEREKYETAFEDVNWLIWDSPKELSRAKDKLVQGDKLL